MTCAYSDPNAYVRVNNILKKPLKLHQAKKAASHAQPIGTDNKSNRLRLKKNSHKSAENLAELRYVSEPDRSRDNRSTSLRGANSSGLTWGEQSFAQARKDD
jgi:hypothetical protein